MVSEEKDQDGEGRVHDDVQPCEDSGVAITWKDSDITFVCRIVD